MAAIQDETLIETALRMALLGRQPSLGLVFHSDRGSQYTSDTYRAVLAGADITASMSRTGNSYDNAVTESFFGTLIASGEKQLFEQCKPVFEGFTSTIFYLGDFGAGTKMKCVANLLVGIHVLAAAEAMTLSTKAGLDPATVIQVISPSVASSAQFMARAQMMVDHRYEPALSTILQLEECIGVINDLADAVDCPTPMLDKAAQYYEDAISSGLGKQDVAAMYSFLENALGARQ